MPDDANLEDPVVEEAEIESGRDPGTVLLTGCSSGVGRATALRFLEEDWTVYATARNRSDLDDLAEVGCHTATLDVTDWDAIDSVVDRVFSEDGRLDCLVNNAGFGAFGPLEEVSTEQLHRQFDVNVYGPHRLIRAVLPHMREQERGTIVNVSSIGGRVAYPGGGAYCGSKFALEAMSDALRMEVREHGIDVVLVEPGPLETAFTDRAEAEVEKLEWTGAYEWFYDVFEDTQAIGGGGPGSVPPEAVADAILQAASCTDPHARYPVGTAASVGPLARFLPDAVRDRLFAVVKRFITR